MKFNESITKAEVFENCGTYKLVLYSSLPSFGLFPEIKCVKTYEDSELHYGEKDELIDFGMWYHDQKKRPGHGGYWSSNHDFVNEELGINCINVVIVVSEGYKLVGHVKVDFANKFIPSGYEIILDRHNSYTLIKKEEL